MESFATPYPVFFQDDSGEPQPMGIIGVHSVLTFKRFISLMAQKINLPVGSFSAVFVCRRMVRRAQGKFGRARHIWASERLASARLPFRLDAAVSRQRVTRGAIGPRGGSEAVERLSGTQLALAGHFRPRCRPAARPADTARPCRWVTWTSGRSCL